jgi:hypothetical protein
MIKIKDYGIERLEDEVIPHSPPHPGMLCLSEDPEERKKVYTESRIPGSLAYHLVRSAFRLMELSKARQGKYDEGCEIPESCRAASIGAIVVACAAIEALMNELMIETATSSSRGMAQAKCKLIELSIGLSPEKRLEAISAIFGKCITWSGEPYQSLRYLFSVRKHLLHHETKWVAPSDGFWPSKKLKELARIIRTPYPLDSEPPLSWDQHILTPNGAEWALKVMSDIIVEIKKIEVKLRETMQSKA